jgi:hypothetical protein
VLGSGEFNKDFILPEENFTYMSIRTKIQFENGQQAMSGNATVRLKKDSAIWVSVNVKLESCLLKLLDISLELSFTKQTNLLKKLAPKPIGCHLIVAVLPKLSTLALIHVD